MAFDGPYDLTIGGNKPQSSHLKQPIYTTADGDKKQPQPIYANSAPANPAMPEIYHSIPESSTDGEYVTVYADIGSDKTGSPITAPIKSGQESCQESSLYYARSDSHPGTTNDEPPPYSTVVDPRDGWEDNVAYSSFDDNVVLRDQENLEQEGWEDNTLYSVNDMAGNEEDGEQWEDNSIYAGSDDKE